MSDNQLDDYSDGSNEPSSEVASSSIDNDPDVPIEELPLERRLVLANRFNFFKYVKEGDFLDAQDTINMWCMASIEEIVDETKILVHYDGWSNKWDHVSVTA